MGLASFNRMRKVYEEAKKVEEAMKEQPKEEKIVVAEVVEQPTEEQPVEEPTPTRRSRRRNQE